MAVSPKTVIADRYRVLASAGSGGMGAVSVAEDVRLGRRVAIKRLHAERAETVSARFRREARIGAAVHHPNLITVYDLLPADDDVLLVMEYIEGQSLAEALRQGGALPPAQALRVLEGVAAALDHLHDNRIVHRDVKPSNILLGLHGDVRLADLGIASTPDMTRITQSGDVLGTAAYLAPEVLCGEKATTASDIYALAAVAFETLAGRRAHTGRTPMEIARQVVDEPPPDLREAAPEVTAAAAEVLKRGMTRDPADRFRRAGELVDALRDALKPRPAPAPAPRRPLPATERLEAPRTRSQTRRRAPTGRALGLAALAAVALGVAGAALLGLRGGDEPSQPRQKATQERKARPAQRPSTPAAATVSAPAQAVQDFYRRAAEDRYQEAWALAGPRFRAQLGGFDAFRAQFSSLRSITFARAETTSQTADRATVAISTTAVHINKTDRCAGTVDLVRSASDWLLDHIAVSC